MTAKIFRVDTAVGCAFVTVISKLKQPPPFFLTTRKFSFSRRVNIRPGWVRPLDMFLRDAGSASPHSHSIRRNLWQRENFAKNKLTARNGQDTIPPSSKQRPSLTPLSRHDYSFFTLKVLCLFTNLVLY